MCYEKEILQQIIDNAYEGDVQEVLAHIKTCPACRDTFDRLKKNDVMVEEALQSGMVIPPRQPIGIYSINSMEKEKKRGIFEMNKSKKRWAAVAAGIILCSGLFFYEPIRVKAQDLLKMFRVQEIKGISISHSDIDEINRMFEKGNGVKDIKNFGYIEMSSHGEEYNLDNLKGPNDIKNAMPNAKLIYNTGDFIYNYASITPKADVTFELDVYKINDFLNYAGEESRLPEEIHQKPFIIKTNDVLNYNLVSKPQNQDEEQKWINVIQMDSPVIEISNELDEKELIKAMYSLTFLPANLKTQLMGIGDLTSTLPIPYDSDYEEKKDITVRGQKAILIENKHSNINNFRLYFKENDTLYFVNADNCTVDELLTLVESME